MISEAMAMTTVNRQKLQINITFTKLETLPEKSTVSRLTHFYDLLRKSIKITFRYGNRTAYS